MEINNDITERKRAEIELEGTRLQAERIAAQLRTILDNMEERLFVCDPEGKVLEANEAARKTFPPDKRMVVPSVFDVGELVEVFELDGRPLPRFEWPISRVLRGEHVHSAETRVRFPATGEERVLSSNGAPVWDRSGNIVMGVLTSEDITERKQADEEIRKLNAELEQRVLERTAELTASNKELEAFSYSVSHDLRAPLRHIDGFSRMLLERYSAQLDAKGQHYLEEVRAGAQKMARLVDELLALSRVGRQELRLQIIGLNSLFEEARTELMKDTGDRHFEWKIAVLPFVACDLTLMRQAVTNLLSNAVKYTRPREQAVIEVGQMEQGNETVVFVRDNGVGFEMKYVDKLFGVFQRLHRTEDFEGTGVGLATVQRIIGKHTGRIWAEAELDKGATFFFTVRPEQAEAQNRMVAATGGSHA